MLLSLFCGAGGLDCGFEAAGYKIGMAFDRNADSIESYNHNRNNLTTAYTADVRDLDLCALDRFHGGQFAPQGVIGGPPCQSFSQANVSQKDEDPRQQLPLAFAQIVIALNSRNPIDFFVIENVPGLLNKRHIGTLTDTTNSLKANGFNIRYDIVDAQFYGTPQRRRRLFVVGYNTRKYGSLSWEPPAPYMVEPLTVRSVLSNLPEPIYFARGIDSSAIPHHGNHWCMQPKSKKFSTPGALTQGRRKARSFKTLEWDQPSIAVAYGHREVHIHPNGKRRLSVYEAMLLQGFPTDYELLGTLSSQINQVSEAVPPPLAEAIAKSIYKQLTQTPNAL